MDTIPLTTIIIAIVFALICVIFFVTRRLMRLMVRLALAGALILFVLIGGLAWWYSHEQKATAPPQREKPSPVTRPANSR